jgi:hypothetical protein
MGAFARGFFNDTYLTDQNACTSPHAVIWIGEAQTISAAKKRLWGALHEIVQSEYDVQPVIAVDKLTRLMEDAIDKEGVSLEAGTDNLIVRIHVDSIPEDLDKVRCAGGYFLETEAASLAEIAPIVNRKFQTMTYCGFDEDELHAFVLESRLPGVDRIVPVGKAMDFDLIWDGYDLVSALSRTVSVLGRG